MRTLKPNRALLPLRYLQSLRVAGYVPGHAAEPLAMTVHRSPGTGALGRAGLAVHSGGQDQRHNSHQQPERSRLRAARANWAQSSHHHCGKWGANVRPAKCREKMRGCSNVKRPAIPERAQQTLHAATDCRPPFRLRPSSDVSFCNFSLWFIHLGLLSLGEGCEVGIRSPPGTQRGDRGGGGPAL